MDMSKTIGFIGCGNMGKAILQGIIKNNFAKPSEIILSRRSKDELLKLKEEFNIETSTDNKEVAKKSDIIILAVKPNMYKSIIEEIKAYIKEEAIIISIAAGLELKTLKSFLSETSKIVRTMPNTPAMVGEGMTAICPNENVTEEELEYVKELFNSLGKVEELEEKNFDAFTALCGSSPAYVFMFIEAMADGAVKLGIPRNKAYKMAEQAILGASKLALETGKHPAELKDMVCSPGGTTIDAVAELEKNNFRYSVISAMEVCAKKSEQMK